MCVVPNSAQNMVTTVVIMHVNNLERVAAKKDMIIESDIADLTHIVTIFVLRKTKR